MNIERVARSMATNTWLRTFCSKRLNHAAHHVPCFDQWPAPEGEMLTRSATNKQRDRCKFTQEDNAVRSILGCAAGAKSTCRTLLLAASMAVLSACGGGSSGDAPGHASRAGPTGIQQPTALSAGTERAATAQADPGADMLVVGVTRVSETPVSRTHFDYVLKLTVRNTSAFPYTNVVLTLTAAGPGTTVIDATVGLGAIVPGTEVTAADTVTVRQDRTLPFNASALRWQIAGTAGSSPQSQLVVLEATGKLPKVERGPTLQGIDADGNGIRDDIDAYIAAQVPPARPASRCSPDRQGLAGDAVRCTAGCRCGQVCSPTRFQRGALRIQSNQWWGRFKGAR